ncbi:MAG: ABC transporter permease [Chryseolinea sp.]
MNSTLISNYFTTAYRHLTKAKVFAFVNILGLALGMSAALLIYEYTLYERSFDTFHDGSENIYRVTTVWNKHLTPEDKRATTMPWSGPNVKEAFSEVLDYARIAALEPMTGTNSVSNGTVSFQEQNIFMADPGFLLIFSFELVQGDDNTALNEPGNIVITESIARKYFRGKDPIGSTLFMQADNLVTGDFKITGVIKDPPVNSHLQFDFLLSYKAIPSMLSDGSTYWHWDYTYCYLKVRPDTDIHNLEQKMSELRTHQYGKDFGTWNDQVDFKLQPIRDIHLNPSLRAEPSQNSDGRSVQFLMIVGFCILASAYINYFNMSTVSLLERRKEIGVRKVVGSSRAQLVLQFTAESFLINLFAFVVSIGLCFLSKPLLEYAFNIKWPDINDVRVLKEVFAAAVMLFTGVLLSSLYPSIVFTGFRPVDLLTGSMTSAGTAKNSFSMRHALTVAQFVFCFGFITGTIIIYRQLQFMQNHDLGMNMDRVVAIRGFGFQPYSEYQDFKHRLMSSPAVTSIGWSTAAPGDEVMMLGLRPMIKIEGEIDSAELKLVSIDEDFLSTLDIRLLAGRNFDPSIKTDSFAVVINEAAADALGFKDPNDLLGKTLTGILGERSPVKIVGVTRNHHQRSLKDKFEPILYVPSWQLDLGWNNRYYFIKLDKDFLAKNSLDASIRELQLGWNQTSPKHPFSYTFLDSKFEDQYKSDVAFGKLFLYFSIFAVFIACLGLFGLVSYITLQRTREIGIRKILGATVKNILVLLTGDIVRLMILAAIFAVPLSWYIFDNWLQAYAFRISIGVALMCIPIGVIGLISILTVVFRSYNVATANPVDSIRHE